MDNVAVVLAGGRGKRMGADVAKQYMMLAGKPLIYYSLKTFDDSFMDAVVLVCGAGEEDVCRNEIVGKYGLKKVAAVVAGGTERYDSVYKGIMAAPECRHIFIHDGARPFVSEYVLERCLHYAEKYGAAVAAVRVKDTVKIEDGDGFISESPDRSLVWLMQTPQVFDYPMIKNAYAKLETDKDRLKEAGVSVTDDTMVAKMYADIDAKLVESTYDNFKITTPEDLITAEEILKRR